jgi:aromatic ring-cleaving dioxygenase
MVPESEIRQADRRDRVLGDFMLTRASETDFEEEDHRTLVEWINLMRHRLDVASDAETDEEQYRAWQLLAADALAKAESILRHREGELSYLFEIPDRVPKMQ